MDDAARESLALDLAHRVLGVNKDNMEVVSHTWRWQVRAGWKRFVHLFGLHDTVPVLVWDDDKGVMEPMRYECWICFEKEKAR